MPTILDGAVGTQSINQDRIVVDMADKISLLKPKDYPLTAVLSKIGKRPTHNYKFEWLEEDLSAVWSTCAGGATDVATTVNVAVGEGALFAVGDIVRVTSTSEVMKVTAVVADALTVVRGYGDVAGTAIPANEPLLITTNAHMQGSGAGTEKATFTRTLFNYTQILKTPFSVTNTLDAMKLYGGKEYSRLANRKGIEHGRSIEQAVLFGQKKLDLTGAQPLSTMGGIDSFLRASRYQAIDETAVTYDALIDLMEEVFQYGSSEKLWLVSATWISKIQKIAKDYLQIMNADNDKTLGLNIIKLVTPHGTLKMVQHPLFVQGLAGYSMILDLEEIDFRPLQGRDTKLKTNIQNNDEDGRRDQYITEAGIEMKQPKKHKIVQMNLGV